MVLYVAQYLITFVLKGCFTVGCGFDISCNLVVEDFDFDG